MLGARGNQAARLLFRRPIGDKFLSQLAELFNGPAFGLIRRAAVGKRGIYQVGTGAKPRQDMRPPRQPLLP